MPENSQAKARALRIPLDSHSGDRMAFYRNALSITAVLLCVGWLLTGFLSSKSIENRYSPGPLSKVHAQLDCTDCHADSAPLRDATFLSGLGADQESDKLWCRVSDMLCRECHPLLDKSQDLKSSLAKYPSTKIDYPMPVAPHTDNQIIDTVDSCASCHSEHRGLDHLPSQVTDKKCIDCHQNLDGFRSSHNGGIANQINSFEIGHPKFDALESDPGMLKFNHDLHMTAGLIKEGDQEKLKRKLDSYPDHNGQLNDYVDEHGLIQLDCNFCHQPTDEIGVSPTNAISNAASGTGKFMSMPTYEESCRVCHSIDLLPNSALDVNGNRLFKSKFKIRKLGIKHGASPTEISEALKAYFALEFIASEEIRSQISENGIQMPIELPIKLWDFQNPNTSVPKIVQEDFVIAQSNFLDNKCFKCHLKSNIKNETGLSEVQTIVNPIGNSKRKQVFLSNWFTKGLFDHAAHRDVACADCHSQKVDGQIVWSFKDDKPMIKDHESCVQCHQSPSKVTPPNRPGPTNCMSCHTYHARQ